MMICTIDSSYVCGSGTLVPKLNVFGNTGAIHIEKEIKHWNDIVVGLIKKFFLETFQSSEKKLSTYSN